MPELYAASLMDEAKPVGKPAEPKTRKPRQKKVKEEEEADDAPNPAPITPPAEKLVDIPMKKDKKPPTEKQLAAREKARQTRMAKVLKRKSLNSPRRRLLPKKDVWHVKLKPLVPARMVPLPLLKSAKRKPRKERRLTLMPHQHGCTTSLVESKANSVPINPKRFSRASLSKKLLKSGATLWSVPVFRMYKTMS